jgi:hypothetical protein
MFFVNYKDEVSLVNRQDPESLLGKLRSREWHFKASLSKNFKGPPSQPIVWLYAHVIPAMREAEIGRPRFQPSPVQNSFTSPHLNGKKLCVVVHICHPSYNRNSKIGG